MNAPDPAVRRNRLALLHTMLAEFSTIADFSEIVTNLSGEHNEQKRLFFGGGTADGDGTMKDVLGGKGAGLAEMSRAGLPVPAGLHHRHRRLQHLLQQQQADPGRNSAGNRQGVWPSSKSTMGQKLGEPRNPLLLSVRSGAKFSMPGMMNTILNLGLNDATTDGLRPRSGNPRFAYDCYRRFIQMFGEVALDIDMAKFDQSSTRAKPRSKPSSIPTSTPKI